MESFRAQFFLIQHDATRKNFQLTIISACAKEWTSHISTGWTTQKLSSRLKLRLFSSRCDQGWSSLIANPSPKKYPETVLQNQLLKSKYLLEIIRWSHRIKYKYKYKQDVTTEIIEVSLFNRQYCIVQLIEFLQLETFSKSWLMLVEWVAILKRNCPFLYHYNKDA